MSPPPATFYWRSPDRTSANCPLPLYVAQARASQAPVHRCCVSRGLARDYRETAVLPSSNQERVGVLVLRFSKLNSPAHRYPCLRFKRHLAMSPARLRAKMESLAPFLS